MFQWLSRLRARQTERNEPPPAAARREQVRPKPLSIVFWRRKGEEYLRRREKEKQDLDVYQSIAQGAISTLDYYLLIVLSCVIATAGLIQGSVAVIIGAMIIAPLMTPILAVSLAIIWGDLRLSKTALLSLAKGIALAIVISAVIAAVVPIAHFSSEILSRTRPSVFDIIVALAAGALAAYGYANRRVVNALMGIAIAVSLMPPLCTIGIGIGRLDSAVAGGAALLFAANLISISLAGAIVFWVMKIRPRSANEGEIKRRAIWQIVLSILLLAAIAVPVALYTKKGFELDQVESVVHSAVEAAIPRASVISLTTRPAGDKYALELTLGAEREPDAETIRSIETRVKDASPVISSIDVTYIKTTRYSSD